jgi:5'(3')-deoxyribonucleotidase
MRIGIDCDGVLRDLITCITDSVKETHPQHADKILTPESWDWEQWLPFWTDDETEKYVFEDNYLDFFGPECPPIKSAVEDWNKLRAWAIENGHELILVSAQREHCIEPTEHWLQRWGFIGWDGIHFTKEKHLVDVNVLIDDSPEKLEKFNNESITGGKAICMKQSWNQECHNMYMGIDRLSDLMALL